MHRLSNSILILALAASPLVTACSGSDSGPDSGSPEDSGSPVDSGSPIDSGTPDSGTPDSGTPVHDAGTVDAGQPDAGPTFTGYTIVSAGGSAPSAVPGDALALKIVQSFSDGTTQPLPEGATVTWTTPITVTAADAGGTLFEFGATSPVPAFGAQPTAIFVENAVRASALSNVLFVLDNGTAGATTLAVEATVAGTATQGTATGSVALSAALVGSATSGATLFGQHCSFCHGQTGDGSPASAQVDGGYMIAGQVWPYPAPGLNAATGHVGSFPTWTGVSLALSARSDMNPGGFALYPPMPDFYVADGGGLSTQNLEDIYAWLATQTQ